MITYKKKKKKKKNHELPCTYKYHCRIAINQARSYDMKVYIIQEILVPHPNKSLTTALIQTDTFTKNASQPNMNAHQDFHSTCQK